jgi:hypothetical protein
MAKPSPDPWNAVRTALARAAGVKSVLDLSDGARLSGELARAGFEPARSDVPLHDLLQLQRLPLATKSVDCVLCVDGFGNADPAARRRLLRDAGRVSRRWILAAYRPRYSLANGVARIAAAFGFGQPPLPRVSRRELRRELEDAGLRMAQIVAMGGFPADNWLVLAEAGDTDPEALAIRLRGTAYADLAVTEKLGEGKRSVVYRAHWRGRDVSVKVYKPAAMASHARRHPLPLAEFEHRRNKAFFEARGLAKYVAQPLGFVVEPGFQMSLQELVDGEVYYFAKRENAGFISARFMEDLDELVSLSHEAQLYDIDLHAMNVMVDRRHGSPKLFDFNQIPFDERPQNPLVWLALRVGLLGRGARDRRKLASFHDFERIERRLLKFYRESTGPRG